MLLKYYVNSETYDNTTRNTIIDAVKGLSILAVFLYHFGGDVLPYGYLGVDVFFVISGYFLARELSYKIQNKKFRYWDYLSKKIVRLWPLIIISSSIAMIIGFFLMLPDDYENLSESVIASSIFSNNILQRITTKNYWDVVNLYKPLMHLWYVGVLMQAYIILPLPYILIKDGEKRRFRYITIVITILSFTLYTIHSISTAWKFYSIPFRVYEITSGGLVFYINQNVDKKKIICYISVLCICILICSRELIISNSFMLIATVIFSVLILSSSDVTSSNRRTSLLELGLASIGRKSYSIYIWHQIIIAFLFYSFTSSHSIIVLMICIALTTVVSWLSYKYIEVPLTRIPSSRSNAIIRMSVIFAAVLCLFSYNIYMHAGVVRDVPELGIYTRNIHKNMHSEYCDRPYNWDQDFENDSRKNILVLGNSFARDWANILYEYDSSIEISYIFYTKDNFKEKFNRVISADIVFYALGPGYDDVPSEISEIGDKLYIVGNKNFGESNGIIYAHRKSKDYHKQLIDIPTKLKEQNYNQSKIWKERYVDLISPVSINGRVKVFTEDGMFISQDCRHLTKAGAQYYARILDLEKMLKSK